MISKWCLSTSIRLGTAILRMKILVVSYPSVTQEQLDVGTSQFIDTCTVLTMIRNVIMLILVSVDQSLKLGYMVTLGFK